MRTKGIVLLQLLLICILIITASLGTACSKKDIGGQCSPGCPYHLVGDGICSDSCNNAVCNYDGGDCINPSPTQTAYCATGCPANWIGDGECNDTCYTLACSYDSGDCSISYNECSLGCPVSQVNDGTCNPSCNNATCSYDQSDCTSQAVSVEALYNTPALITYQGREGQEFSSLSWPGKVIVIFSDSTAPEIIEAEVLANTSIKEWMPLLDTNIYWLTTDEGNEALLISTLLASPYVLEAFPEMVMQPYSSYNIDSCNEPAYDPQSGQYLHFTDGYTSTYLSSNANGAITHCELVDFIAPSASSADIGFSQTVTQNGQPETINYVNTQLGFQIAAQNSVYDSINGDNATIINKSWGPSLNPGNEPQITQDMISSYHQSNENNYLTQLQALKNNKNAIFINALGNGDNIDVSGDVLNAFGRYDSLNAGGYVDPLDTSEKRMILVGALESVANPVPASYSTTSNAGNVIWVPQYTTQNGDPIPGTSFAAPQISYLLEQIRQDRPDLSSDQLIDVIFDQRVSPKIDGRSTIMNPMSPDTLSTALSVAIDLFGAYQVLDCGFGSGSAPAVNNPHKCCNIETPYYWSSDGGCHASSETACNPGLAPAVNDRQLCCPLGYVYGYWTGINTYSCCSGYFPYYWVSDGSCHVDPECSVSVGIGYINALNDPSVCCTSGYPYYWSSDGDCHVSPECDSGYTAAINDLNVCCLDGYPYYWSSDDDCHTTPPATATPTPTPTITQAPTTTPTIENNGGTWQRWSFETENAATDYTWHFGVDFTGGIGVVTDDPYFGWDWSLWGTMGALGISRHHYIMSDASFPEIEEEGFWILTDCSLDFDASFVFSGNSININNVHIKSMSGCNVVIEGSGVGTADGPFGYAHTASGTLTLEISIPEIGYSYTITLPWTASGVDMN